MMRDHTKRCLASAIDNLKRDGYSVLLLMFDKGSDESRPLGDAIEILSSETNDPAILADMAKTALKEMANPISMPKGTIH